MDVDLIVQAYVVQKEVQPSDRIALKNQYPAACRSQDRCSIHCRENWCIVVAVQCKETFGAILTNCRSHSNLMKDLAFYCNFSSGVAPVNWG